MLLARLLCDTLLIRERRECMPLARLPARRRRGPYAASLGKEVGADVCCVQVIGDER